MLQQNVLLTYPYIMISAYFEATYHHITHTFIDFWAWGLCFRRLSIATTTHLILCFSSRQTPISCYQF